MIRVRSVQMRRWKMLHRSLRPKLALPPPAKFLTNGLPTSRSLGTIESRINPARTRLAEVLAISSEEDLGPDRLVKAALVMHSAS